MGWLSGYDYRKKITIEGTTAGAQTDYQMGIKVYRTTGVDGTESVDGITMGKVYVGTNCETDFDDIRFTQSDETTEIDQWKQEVSGTSYAIYWVEIPSIPSGTGTVDIYIYYGNASATEKSSVANTFLDGDDFESGTEIDTGIWTSVAKDELYNTYDEVTGGEYHAYVDSDSSTAGYVWALSSSSTSDIRVFGKTRWAGLDWTRGGGVYLGIIFRDNDNQLSGWGMRLWGDYYNACLKYIDGAATNYNESDSASGNETFLYEKRGTVFDTASMSGTVTRNFNGTTISGFSAPYTVEIFARLNYWTAAVEVDSYFKFVVVGKYANPEPTFYSWGSEEEAGWGHKIQGIEPAKVDGVDQTNIAKIQGVA